MHSVWEATRIGGMTPVERAAVFGSCGLLLGLVTWWSDTDLGAERAQFYDVAWAGAQGVAIGLLTVAPRLWRAIAAGIVLGGIDVAIDVGLGRAHALDAGVVVAAVLSGLVGAGTVDLVDPPARGRVKAEAARGVWRRVMWAAYYGVSALLLTWWMIGTVLTLHPLVNFFLPSLKLVDPSKDQDSGTMLGSGIVLLGVLSWVLLWNEWRDLSRAGRLAGGRAASWGWPPPGRLGVAARLKRGLVWGLWGLALGVPTAIGLWVVQEEVQAASALLARPPMCRGLELAVPLLLAASTGLVLGLWWPAEREKRGLGIVYAGRHLLAVGVGVVAAAAALAGLELAYDLAAAVLSGRCGESTSVRVFAEGMREWTGINGIDGMVILGLLVAAVLVPPAAHWVWRLLRSVSLVSRPPTEKARIERGLVWAALAVTVAMMPGVLRFVGGETDVCDFSLVTEAAVWASSGFVIGVWWPTGTFGAARWSYARRGYWALNMGGLAVLLVSALGLRLGVALLPGFGACQMPFEFEGTVADQIARDPGRQGLAIGLLMLLLWRPVWVGLMSGWRLRPWRRGGQVERATVSGGALGRWARRDG